MCDADSGTYKQLFHYSVSGSECFGAQRQHTCQEDESGNENGSICGE